MGFFDIQDPSQCDKPKSGMMMNNETTAAQLLMMGATMCCKSKEIDETVCKVDACVSGVSKCLSMHNDFDAVSERLTDPRAMDTDEDGNLFGSCATAIANGVEGALCCTAGMKQMTTCVSTAVGDYTLCKDSWNNAFEPNFFDTAEAIMAAFKPGGYCLSPAAAVPTTTAEGPASQMINGKPCLINHIVLVRDQECVA